MSLRLSRLSRIERKVDILLSTLADLQTSTAALTVALTDLDAREAAEGPAISQAVLDTTVAAIDAANAHIAALDVPPAPQVG